jgi:hypothetical protein
MVEQGNVSETYLNMCLFAVQCRGTEIHSAISGITRNQGNMVSGVLILVLW